VKKLSAGQVENAIIDYIRKQGGWARKIHVLPVPIRKKVGKQWLLLGYRKNPKMVGMADIYVMANGITTRVEVKRPGHYFKSRKNNIKPSKPAQRTIYWRLFKKGFFN